MVIDEKQSENTNDMEEEVASTSNSKVMTVDESKTEVAPTAMVHKIVPSHWNCLSFHRNRKQHRM